MYDVTRRDYGKNSGSGERRRGERYPIQEEVQYRLVGPGAHLIRGTGVSLNFSRTGIEFTTNVPLPVGGEIEFSVNWPAELNAQCALKFMGTGRVVRAADDRAAVKICKYEFRTRRKQSAEPRVMQPEVLDGTDTRRLPPLRAD